MKTTPHLLALVCLSSLLLPMTVRADDDSRRFSAGVALRAEASAADVGLPDYPGAVPQRDHDEDSDAVDLGLWGGHFGLRVVVAKFAVAGEQVETVARFYRRALARYGEVLDCGQPQPPLPKPARGGPKPLSCDKDDPKPGERRYKVGSANLQRIVHVEPAGSDQVHFQLVLVQIGKP